MAGKRTVLPREHGRPRHAGGRGRREGEAEVPPDDGLEPSAPGRRERVGPGVRPRRAERIPGGGRGGRGGHPDPRGVAVLGGRGGPVPPDGGRLVDGGDDDQPAGGRCPGHGRGSSPRRVFGSGGPLGSGQPVRERARPAATGRGADHPRHEPSRERLGQRADGEALFASLKKELAHGEDDATRDEATASVFEYVEAFDNRVRRHSSLGHVTPAEFERTHNQTHR